MSTQRPSQACRFFSTAAGCRFGDHCKFSHTASQSGQHSHKDGGKGRVPHRDLQESYHKWVYDIPRSLPAPPLLFNLTPFLAKACELVSQDAGDRQAVIERLSTEGGLCRINEVVANIERAHGKPESNQITLFTKQIFPLFKILAHQDVVSSLLLERHVDTISNFLFGIGGQRSLTIFNFVARMIEVQCKDNANADSVEALEAGLAVLCKIVNLNGSAVVTEGFASILESFQISLLTLEHVHGQIPLENARASIEKIQRRLGLGAAFPEAKIHESAKSVQPTFKLKREGPGMLCDSGRRHDNDCEDIQDIQILPTASELQSQQNEYLPHTDPSRFHKGGSQRLIDRQFRLLREDTIGCLRDAVRNVVNTDSHNRSAARTYTYQNALLLDMRFHSFNGIELLYQFEQPGPAKLLSTKARKEWWTASKRLQQGAPVCLLDTRGAPIFCSVADTGLAPSEMKKKPAETAFNVYDNPDAAFVTFSLVETNHASLDKILGGFITGHQRGFEMLVELPGVLLPSFLPSLQALQGMSRANELPFADLLAPVAASDTNVVEVQPPAYSRKGGFRFDLSCLTDGHVLSLSPKERFDFKTLPEKSTLDEAQAAGLVSALTRKLALISGTPRDG